MLSILATFSEGINISEYNETEIMMSMKSEISVLRWDL